MSLQISWEKIDKQAKSNSSLQMSNLQDFANVDLLKDVNIDAKNIASIGELNQTILDDEQLNFPTDTSSYKFYIWSKAISNEKGEFENEQKLTINFSEPVNSSGITLVFWEPSNDYCSKIKINWYDGANVLLSSKEFSINNYEYFCANVVENYSKLEIIFLKTANPNRFIKLSGIYYGEAVNLDDSNIITAELLEQMSLSLDTLYANELDLTIINLDDNFNIITNPGLFASVQPNQELSIKMNSKELGLYYIEDSKVNDNILSLVCFDLIGVLESKEFSGGLYSTNTTFSTILNQIIQEAKLLELFNNEHNGFDVPQEILDKPIFGYIPITNCREALHMLCYSASVVAKYNRGEKIKIFKLDSTKKDDIEKDRTILGSYEITNNEKYTGVTLNAFTYSRGSDSEQLVNDEYEVGTFKVTFNEPKYDYFASGATIISSSVNHVEFKVTAAGTVNITGKKYDVTVTPVTQENTKYYGTNKIIKQMQDVTLVHPSYSEEVCKNQLNYYLKRYSAKSDVLQTEVTLGDNVNLRDINGYVTKIQTDLIQEDISGLEVIGDAKFNN